MQLKLSLDSLGALDNGAAELAVNAELAKAVRDLIDRGAEDGKPRIVNIQVSLVIGKHGDVEVYVQAAHKPINRRTRPTICLLKQRHSNDEPTLMFRDTAPREPNQTTIDDHADAG